MKQLLQTILLVLFCFSMGSSGWAKDTGPIDGHDVSWGKGIEAFPGLELYKTAGDIKYYQNPDSSVDCDVLAGITSSHVAYGFRSDKLFARIVRIDTLDAFNSLHDHLVGLYGEPKEKMDNATHIDRWQAGDLKIKLKFNKQTKSMKMGTYFVGSADEDFDLEKSFEATP